MGQIDLLNNDSFLIGPCVKKYPLMRQLKKNIQKM